MRNEFKQWDTYLLHVSYGIWLTKRRVLGIKTTHRLRAVGHVVHVRWSWNPAKRFLCGFSWRNALIFETFVKKKLGFFFSASCMNGVKFGISKFCGRSSSVMTVIPYAGVFLNNDVRALYIFPDTVTASLLRSISKTRNETYLVWLFPI